MRGKEGFPRLLNGFGFLVGLFRSLAVGRWCGSTGRSVGGGAGQGRGKGKHTRKEEHEEKAARVHVRPLCWNGR